MAVSNGCAPDPRVLRHARWLVQEKHEVTVYAFDRHQNLELSEVIDGVDIVRIRVGKTPYGGLFTTWRGVKKFREKVGKLLKDIDLLYCHDADMLPLLKSVKDIPVIFDMHDLHHTWILMKKPKSVIRRIFALCMKKRMFSLAKKVDLIITSSPGFTTWLSHHNLDSHSIENRPKNNDKLDFPSSPVIGYFGRVREKAPFLLLRDALLNFSEDECKPSVLIAGDGIHANEVAEIFNSATEIVSEIRGPFLESELPIMMSEISLMFAMYSPERGNITEGALPSKMFEAASYGRPSIVNKGILMGEICENEGLGSSVFWGDVDNLKIEIMRLIGTSVELSVDASREHSRFIEEINKLKI
jgi:glycosyltransferase involved in cell wall biosynthesis